jgi:hypothetical protein
MTALAHIDSATRKANFFIMIRCIASKPRNFTPQLGVQNPNPCSSPSRP